MSAIALEPPPSVRSERPQVDSRKDQRKDQRKETLLKPLHGVRGWLALIVFTYHVWSNAFWDMATTFAVQGFFCLSGFILAYVYRETLLQRVSPRVYLDFVCNRFSRVLPLYYVTALAALSLILAGRFVGYKFNHDWDTSPLVILANFFAFDIALASPEKTGIFYPYVRWSVSVEIWLYLFLFPLLAWLYPFVAASRRVVRAIFVVSIAVGALAPLWYSSVPCLKNLLGRGITYFAIGFFVYALRLRTLSHRAHYSVLGLFALCTALICAFGLATTLMPLAAALMILLAAYSRADEPVCRFLSNRSSIFLGDISYSLYLWHSVVLLGLSWPIRKFFPPEYRTIVMLGVIFPLVFFLSWLSYKYLEVPARNWLRRSKLGGRGYGFQIMSATVRPAGMNGSTCSV